MSQPLDTLIDNPLIVKHLRSRLRLSQLLPWVVVVLSLCTLICGIGYYMGSLRDGSFWWLSSIAALFLVVGGSNQVSSSVGSARESGILDFHRVSPLNPITVTLGFFLGAPIREYLLFALFVPFLVFSAREALDGYPGFFDLAVPTVLTACLVFAFSILVALTAKKPKMASVVIIVILMLSLFIGGFSFFGITMRRAFLAPDYVEPKGMAFFGVRLKTLAWLALYEGTATLFFLIASARKMRSEGALAFSKVEALICMQAIVILVLGAFWQAQDTSWVVPTVVYTFVIAGIIMTTAITPNYGEYLKGVRRALRAGDRRPSIWADAAANTWATYGIAALVAIGATIATEHLTIAIYAGYDQTLGQITYNTIEPGRSSYSITIAIGVFTVAYYGIGKQYFGLRYGKKGELYFRLFLFVLWVLPIVVGIAAGAASLESSAVMTVMGLSPWAGMLLSIRGLFTQSDPSETVRFVALLPSIAFAFVFHAMLTNQQRQIDRTLRKAAGPVVMRNPWNGVEHLEAKPRNLAVAEPSSDASP